MKTDDFIQICDKAKLKSFVNNLSPIKKWKSDIDSYYLETIITCSYHKDNCTKLSSLNNRVFADYEWGVLEEHWDRVKQLFSINDISGVEQIKDIYTKVTNYLFPIFEDEWKEKKNEKPVAAENGSRKIRGYPRPFAEINRLFVGLNKGCLCLIIDDNSLQRLIEELSNSGFIEIKDDLLVTTKQEDGGWLIRSYFINKLFNDLGFDETTPWRCLQKLKDKRIYTLLDNNKNIILTGAPGTGKTYSAEVIAKEFAGEKRVKTIQFHPSYDYTDFVEGMRPDQSNTFIRKDGVFKTLCKCAIMNLPVDASEEEIKKKELEHNSRKNHDANDDLQCLPYVLIIDEINRGEVSKIFGELFFCIEKTHRGEKRDTQYQNLVPSDDLFAKGFYVPQNVFIIGTMNDIDRSVESLDFAFRRRFAFFEFPVDADMLNSLDLDSRILEDVKQHMERLNKELMDDEYGLTSAYQIGGSYFCDFKLYYKFNKYFPRHAKNAFKSLWEYHLKGVIYEYFRGLPQKEIEAKLSKLKKAYDGN